VIDAGMIPKVEACLASLAQGVGKVHVIDGRVRHSLLIEIFTATGIGTEIVMKDRPAPDSRPTVAVRI
jgi:acetylglutamate kinase